LNQEPRNTRLHPAAVVRDGGWFETFVGPLRVSRSRGQTKETEVAHVAELINDFLRCRRIAVVGVSRGAGSAANAVFRRLRDSGYEVFPVNPNASQVEGGKCFPNVEAVPGDLDGIVIATHPDASINVVRQAVERKVPRIWFHRSFGRGSVSDGAVREGVSHGIQCIVGGCPLMYCEPVDFGHRCMRWWLYWRGRIGG
jgi:uncharacterized protein